MSKEDIQKTVAEIEQGVQKLKRQLDDNKSDPPKANTNAEAAKVNFKTLVERYNSQNGTSLNAASVTQIEAAVKEIKKQAE